MLIYLFNYIEWRMMGNIVYSHKFHHRPGNGLALLQYINNEQNV